MAKKAEKDSKGRTLQKGEYEAPDGRYVYQYTDALGKRKKAYSWRLLPSDRHAKGSRKDLSLREKEQKIQEKIAAGLSTSAQKKTVVQLCREYEAIKKQTIAYNTRVSHKTAINMLDKEPFGHWKVGDVTTSDAKAFVVHLQQDEGKSYSTISSVVGVLRPAFDQAVDDGLARKNPFTFMLKNTIKNDTEHRDALTAEEMADFLSFVREDFHYRLYYTGFYLQFFTGMRISEMCGLIEDDIDFEHHYLTIKRQLLRTQEGGYYIGPTKTISGMRKIPLTKDTEECLRAIIKARPKPEDMIEGKEPVVYDEDHKESATGFLFFDKDGRLTVAQHWENHYRYAQGAYRKARPDGTKKTISSHVARHTYCSLRVREGMNPKTLQKVMGHNSIRTTLEWYTHLTDDDIMTETLDLMNGDDTLCGFEAVEKEWHRNSEKWKAYRREKDRAKREEERAKKKKSAGKKKES